MTTRKRKVRRLRGSRTHGWGQIGQHRRTGAKGGSGMAGLHKHKWSYMLKYAPDHFGSNKWHPPHPAVTERWINVGELARVSGGATELDLTSLGYDKLLGQGEITKALNIKVPRASASAIEKVQSAGGKVEVEVVAAPSPPPEQAKGNTPSAKGKDMGKAPSEKKAKSTAK